MKVRSALSAMGTYDPPLEGREGKNLLLLDFNESSQPPSAEVLEAMLREVSEGRFNRYPSYQPLLERLSTYTELPLEQIIITNGSDQGLDIVLRALLDAGDEMVFPTPGFAMIPHIARLQGARVVEVPYKKDMGFPFEALQAAITPRTRLIALIDPNNPTGTLIPAGQLEALLEAHPHIPVLVDEAYFEFTGKTAVPLLSRCENLVISRTFSKALAMAGLRLGYVLSNAAFIGELHKVRGPYDVNALVLSAAAAALEHPQSWRAYVEEVMQRVKPLVERFFTERGVVWFKGAANFMLVRPADRDQACAYLRSRNILVRPQPPPIADTFRLSVGSLADMERFMGVYAEYLDQA